MSAILRRIREVGLQFKINMIEFERGGAQHDRTWFWALKSQRCARVLGTEDTSSGLTRGIVSMRNFDFKNSLTFFNVTAQTTSFTL